MITNIKALLIITLLSFLSLKGLFVWGYFATHDGDFHLVRLAHYISSIQAGYFPPRLIPELAYGYGYPVFHFFYPLVYLFASGFSALGLSLGMSLKLLMGVVSIASGYAFYAWLRSHFTPTSALFGTVLFIFAPFRFVTLYVTGQLGGLFSFLWVPLILLCLFQIIVKKNNLAVVLLGLVVGCFITTHLLSIVAFGLLVAAYAAVLFYISTDTLSQKVLTLKKLLISGVLGFFVSAFYVLPMLLEKHWFKIGNQVIIAYQDHWPSLAQLIYSPWGFGYSAPGASDTMSFQIGFAQLFILFFSVITALFLFFAKRKKSQFSVQTLIAIVFLAVTLITVFLMLPYSKVLWSTITILQTLQYPWRLLSVVVLATGYLTAWLSSKTVSKIIVVPLLFLSLLNTRNYLRPFELVGHNDEYYLENRGLYLGSTDISWELAPVLVKKPPEEKAQSLVFEPELYVNPEPSYFHEFTLTTSEKQKVVLNLFFSPNWQVVVNDEQLTTYPSDEGLVTFEVPAGENVIQLEVVATLVQQLATFISVVTLFGSLLWIIKYTID